MIGSVEKFVEQRDLKTYPLLVPESLKQEKILPPMFEALNPLAKYEVGHVLQAIIEIPRSVLSADVLSSEKIKIWKIEPNADPSLQPLEKLGIKTIISRFRTEPGRTPDERICGWPNTWDITMIGEDQDLKIITAFSQMFNGKILPSHEGARDLTGYPHIHYLISRKVPLEDNKSTIYAQREGCVEIENGQLVLSDEMGGVEYTKIHAVPETVSQAGKLTRINKPDFVQKFVMGRNIWLGDDNLAHIQTTVAESEGHPDGERTVFYEDYFHHDDKHLVFRFQFPFFSISEPDAIASKLDLHRITWPYRLKTIPLAQSSHHYLFTGVVNQDFAVMSDPSLTR